MILNTRTLGAYRVIDVGEPARKYEDIELLKSRLEERLEAGDNFVAINLTDVEFVHSFFIKILTATYKKLKFRGGDLCVIGANEFIRNLINLLNIDDYIAVFNSEESFKSFLENAQK